MRTKFSSTEAVLAYHQQMGKVREAQKAGTAALEKLKRDSEIKLKQVAESQAKRKAAEVARQAAEEKRARKEMAAIMADPIRRQVWCVKEAKKRACERGTDWTQELREIYGTLFKKK